MAYWLMKTEPDAFSIDDLSTRKNQTEPWDGVRNYQARNMMRDDMNQGDKIFFYHSACKTPAIVGVVQVVSSAYPDFTAFDAHSKYYDPKSTADNPRWFMVDVQFVEKFNQPITLAKLKTLTELTQLPLVKRGCRLSIMPVTEHEWQTIYALTNKTDSSI